MRNEYSRDWGNNEAYTWWHPNPREAQVPLRQSHHRLEIFIFDQTRGWSVTRVRRIWRFSDFFGINLWIRSKWHSSLRVFDVERDILCTSLHGFRHFLGSFKVCTPRHHLLEGRHHFIACTILWIVVPIYPLIASPGTTHRVLLFVLRSCSWSHNFLTESTRVSGGWGASDVVWLFRLRAPRISARSNT